MIEEVTKRFLDGMDKDGKPVHSACDYRADVGFLLSLITARKTVDRMLDCANCDRKPVLKIEMSRELRRVTWLK